MGPVRGIAAAAALLLGAYCLVAAAVLYASAQPAAPDVNRTGPHDWPYWIPVAFLAVLVFYGLTQAAQRRGARRATRRSPSGAERAGSGDTRSP
jgi:hypothetical protein